MRVFFTIPGKPRGKARPRAAARLIVQDGEPRAIATVYSDPAMEELEAEIGRLYREAASPILRRNPTGQMPATGPIKVNILAVFDIPKHFTAALYALAVQGKVWHRGTPDLDNIEKLILDGLNHIAFVDDGQVAVVTKGKRYGRPARTEVTIEQLPQEAGTRTPAQAELESKLAAGGLEAVIPAKRGKSTRSKTGTKAGPISPLERAIAAACERDGLPVPQGGKPRMPAAKRRPA